MQKILILMDWVLCFFATSVYPEGQGVKNDLINYRITKKPLKIIANGNVNGIDLNYFKTAIFTNKELQTLKTNLGISPEDFIFIFVGRLVGDKGINELVSAFKQVNRHYSQTRLLLIGDYEQEFNPLQEETIVVINNHPNIISTGFQTDVRPFLAISHALVFPSYREGFPNVPMQAGAMELPSIVTNINGCNEIIQDDVNGIIIAPKDAKALENAMIELFENEEKRNRLAQNARPLIVERYEQQMVWQLIKQEYDEQLGKLGARL